MRLKNDVIYFSEGTNSETRITLSLITFIQKFSRV